ncbi:GntR family transcriptional regulator (plasmid) [Deinococcus sp. KNUC1210]|uniref:GntR family transcriptional regulator n=1 Tax=Deinococcus sp. KNUC1210 TaxID=2917691 RepID=UPI001EF002D9|nr:GntR family transcriptional regulator [Deinococcus sp. KNUC1210]ULH17520.1 GntR family transcriptional regulator [Deinococcus sp. KNUC1210]
MPGPIQTSWPLSIDRSLSVPVGVQLRGQLEYGIACGEIPRGARLASVRELSHELGVAHVTVAQVYKELLARGLIVTQRGRGTFVADVPEGSAGQDLSPLRALLEDTLSQAERAGYSVSQIAETLNVLLARGSRQQPGCLVLLVGLFMDATSAYARDLQDLLRPGDVVEAVTLEDLRAGGQLQRARAEAADVVLSLAHRLSETRSLLPGLTVLPVGFIPSVATRSALAALSPMTRLALVATFEDFLPTFLTGVKRFAPLLSDIRSTHVQAADLSAVIEWAEVVVYASGSEVIGSLTGGRPTFEYRHTIDPRDVEQVVLPALDTRPRSALQPA